MKSLHCSALLALAACGAAETSSPGRGTVTVLAAAATDPGLGILNVHWLPRSDVSSTVHLLLDGETAIWGPGAPDEGSPITLTSAAPTGLLGLAPGTYTIELEATAGVVLSLPDQDIAADKVYALVAYGDPAAPSKRLFVDDNPYAGPTRPAPGPLQVVNFSAGGGAIDAYTVVRQTVAPLTQALPYADLWQGDADPGALLVFDDHAAGAFDGSGAFFGMSVPQGYIRRLYVYGRDPSTGDLTTRMDGFWPPQ